MLGALASPCANYEISSSLVRVCLEDALVSHEEEEDDGQPADLSTSGTSLRSRLPSPFLSCSPPVQSEEENEEGPTTQLSTSEAPSTKEATLLAPHKGSVAQESQPARSPPEPHPEPGPTKVEPETDAAGMRRSLDERMRPPMLEPQRQPQPRGVHMRGRYLPPVLPVESTPASSSSASASPMLPRPPPPGLRRPSPRPVPQAPPQIPPAAAQQRFVLETPPSSAAASPGGGSPKAASSSNSPGPLSPPAQPRMQESDLSLRDFGLSSPAQKTTGGRRHVLPYHPSPRLVGTREVLECALDQATPTVAPPVRLPPLVQGAPQGSGCDSSRSRSSAEPERSRAPARLPALASPYEGGPAKQRSEAQSQARKKAVPLFLQMQRKYEVLEQQKLDAARDQRHAQLLLQAVPAHIVAQRKPARNKAKRLIRAPGAKARPKKANTDSPTRRRGRSRRSRAEPAAEGEEGEGAARKSRSKAKGRASKRRDRTSPKAKAGAAAQAPAAPVIDLTCVGGAPVQAEVFL